MISPDLHNTGSAEHRNIDALTEIPDEDNGMHMDLDGFDEPLVDTADDAFFETQDFESLHLKNLCLFFFKLECKHLLRASTVQDIKDALQDVHNIGVSAMSQKLVTILRIDHSLSSDDARNVVSVMQRYDLLNDCCHSALRTTYIRRAIYKMFHYVAPVSVLLGNNDAGTERFSVPIAESLKSLFKNASVCQEYELSQSELRDNQVDADDSRLLHDICCGFGYKENVLFSAHCTRTG